MTVGEQLKLDGMEAAERARADWASEARGAIDYLAGLGVEFTSEDVTAMVGMPRPDEHESNRNNAVGAVMSAAARAGVIVHHGVYRKAARPSSHAAVLAVWVGADRG